MAGEEGRLLWSYAVLGADALCATAPHSSAAKLGQQLRHSDGLLLMQPMCTGPKVPAAACGSEPCCPFFPAVLDVGCRNAGVTTLAVHAITVPG